MLAIERRGPFAIWTVARPRARNALDFATMKALREAARSAQGDRTLRAVVLTGEGDIFVSGGDLRELRPLTSAEDAARVSDMGYDICQRFAELDVPVIAALPGAAIGGGAELAMACDLRIAEERAKICFKQARMGLTTAWGTLPRLVSLVGPSTAARLLFTGNEVSAKEAFALGLVDNVAEDGTCVATALAWAVDIAQGSPTAIAEMKALLRVVRAAHEPVRVEERARFIATWTSPDHADAVEAFFEGRPPAWRERPTRG